MATKLFFRTDTPASAHLGTDNTRLDGTAVGWITGTFSTSAGSGVLSFTTNTVTGPTAGVDMTETAGGTTYEFISPPVSADVTISGTITANIWCAENNMSANVAINVMIQIIRANATGTRNSNTLVDIVKSTFATEMAVTTRAANNFTTGMTSGAYTSQTLNRGDRLRIRIFGDDAGTMASGFTFSVSTDGATGAADGDTFITFTENFSFESAPSGSQVFLTTTQAGISTAATLLDDFTGADESPLSEGGNWAQLDSGTNQLQRVSNAVAAASLGGTPASYYTVSDFGPNVEAYITISTVSGRNGIFLCIQQPGGTNQWDGYTFTIASGLQPVIGKVTNNVQTNLAVGSSFTVSAGDKVGASRRSDGLLNLWYLPSGGSTWVALCGAQDTTYSTGKIAVSSTATAARLDDLFCSSTSGTFPMQAWTSRGDGVQSVATSTVAGWTAPLGVVEWYTKQLTAFTLTGLAQANLRALESAIAANASLRCEVARVDSDGTNPTVWSTWCISPNNGRAGELNTSEAAETCNVSGDDLSVSNGQRLRIRVYLDDIPAAAMGASQTATFFYNGTSAAASGDSYITFAQTLTEFVGGGVDDKLLTVLQSVNRATVW